MVNLDSRLAQKTGGQRTVFLYQSKMTVQKKLQSYLQNDHIMISVELFRKLSVICKLNDKKIVLMIGEVDSASNNQVFLDFILSHPKQTINVPICNSGRRS